MHFMVVAQMQPNFYTILKKMNVVDMLIYVHSVQLYNIIKNTL